MHFLNKVLPNKVLTIFKANQSRPGQLTVKLEASRSLKLNSRRIHRYTTPCLSRCHDKDLDTNNKLVVAVEICSKKKCYGSSLDE